MRIYAPAKKLFVLWILSVALTNGKVGEGVVQLQRAAFHEWIMFVWKLQVKAKKVNWGTKNYNLKRYQKE